MTGLERWRHYCWRCDTPERILQLRQGRHRSELHVAHHQHPNRAFRRDRRPSRTSLGHGHDVERRSRAILDLRLPGGLHPDHSLKQHVERLGRPTGHGQNFARRRLGCVSLRRQEPELALAATVEKIDAPEHLDLGIGLPREAQQVNPRMPTPSRPRLKLVEGARSPPQRSGPLTRSVHTASLETAAARTTVESTGLGTRSCTRFRLLPGSAMPYRVVRLTY